MYLFVAARNRKGLSSRGGEQVNMGDRLFLVVIGGPAWLWRSDGLGLLFLGLQFLLFFFRLVFGSQRPVGEEGNPASVGRPLRIGIVTGLRQQHQFGRAFAPKPNIIAIAVALPVRPPGRDQHRLAVRRAFYVGVVNA